VRGAVAGGRLCLCPPHCPGPPLSFSFSFLEQKEEAIYTVSQPGGGAAWGGPVVGAAHSPRAPSRGCPVPWVRPTLQALHPMGLQFRGCLSLLP